MNSLETNVLQIISVQSEEYLVKSDSSCFIANGIEPPQLVETAITKLADEKYIEYFEEVIPTLIQVVQKNPDGTWKFEDDGTPLWELGDDGERLTQMEDIVSDRGWKITDAGREALTNLGS